MYESPVSEGSIHLSLIMVFIYNQDPLIQTSFIRQMYLRYIIGCDIFSSIINDSLIRQNISTGSVMQDTPTCQ